MIQRHLFALLLLVAFVPAAPAVDAVRPSAPAHPPGVAIASAHTLATQAGLDVIAQGGNAFDAAIAVSSTLSVVEPISSGLGGGGFFLLHDGKTGKDVFIDARETAPAAATPDKYLLPNGGHASTGRSSPRTRGSSDFKRSLSPVPTGRMEVHVPQDQRALRQL